MDEGNKLQSRDGELFVSQILGIEPIGLTLEKPVTVLLSHSVYEKDQNFVDFYELVVENLCRSGWQDLKTENIASIKGTQVIIL